MPRSDIVAWERWMTIPVRLLRGAGAGVENDEGRQFTLPHEMRCDLRLRRLDRYRPYAR
jgi:hypothetical protein